MPLRAQDWGGSVRWADEASRDGGVCGTALSRAAIHAPSFPKPHGSALSVRFTSRTVGGPSLLWGH